MQQATSLRPARSADCLLGSEDYGEDLQLHPVTAMHLSAIVHSSLATSAGHSPERFIKPLRPYSLTSTPSPTPSNSLPTGWKEFVLPDGQRYFYHPLRHVITRSDIKDRAVLLILVRALVILKDRWFLPETAEVVFYVESNSPVPFVRYYSVDHTKRVIFWLEETMTESLNFPPVTGFGQLKHLLTQQYWVHIRSYPMHHKLSDDVRVDLSISLTHACADYMTSSPPIIPYTQKQCEAFLDLLNDLPRSDQVDGHLNRILAHLGFEIELHYINLLSEDRPGLTRSKRTRRLMNPPPARQHS